MRRLLAATVAAALLAACERGGSAPKPGPESRPVAVVNGQPITADALRRELALARAGEGDDLPQTEVLLRRATQELVDRALLLAEARRRGIQVSPTEAESAFQTERAQYPEGAFDAELAKNGLKVADVQARIADQLTIARLFETAVYPSVSVSEEAVRRHYDEHAAEYHQPAQVRALQIVTRTREEADRALAEVKRRRPFGDVARELSIAPEGKLGGELGWFGRDSGMPEVFDVCFELKAGEVSKVVPSPYGFHIFKVLERRPARRRPFEEVRADIARGLLQDARVKAEEDFVASLRSAAQIQIDEAALAAAAPTGTP